MKRPRVPSCCWVPERKNLAVLLTCMALSFCVWFGGGWLLAGQLTPPADPPLDADVRPHDWRTPTYELDLLDAEADTGPDRLLPES